MKLPVAAATAILLDLCRRLPSVPDLAEELRDLVLREGFGGLGVVLGDIVGFVSACHGWMLCVWIDCCVCVLAVWLWMSEGEVCNELK